MFTVFANECRFSDRLCHRAPDQRKLSAGNVMTHRGQSVAFGLEGNIFARYYTPQGAAFNEYGILHGSCESPSGLRLASQGEFGQFPFFTVKVGPLERSRRTNEPRMCVWIRFAARQNLGGSAPTLNNAFEHPAFYVLPDMLRVP